MQGETELVVPFHRPFIGDDEVSAVVEALRSGWLTSGPRVRRFEQDFAAAVRASHAVALNSATAALHLALEAVGVGAGDEVIVPTYTFAATGEVVTYLGARPVLADCRADTLNLDVSTVEGLVTSRTRAIIPVHIAGQPCDMDPLLALAERHRLRVVEDAAHAFPAAYRGRLIGSISELTAFSFYATKTITTGEGGMVTTSSAALAERIRMMSLHGLSGNAWSRYSARGSWYYDILEFGFKYNMTDIAATLGIEQLKRAEAFAKRRREIAEAYHRAFRGLDTCVPPREVTDGAHAWHLYVLQVVPAALSVDRDAVIRALRRRGIGTSVHFRPLHLHPAYRSLGYEPGQFPVAEAAFETAISLPIYPAMTDRDVETVIEAVRDTLQAARK